MENEGAFLLNQYLNSSRLVFGFGSAAGFTRSLCHDNFSAIFFIKLDSNTAWVSASRKSRKRYQVKC